MAGMSSGSNIAFHDIQSSNTAFLPTFYGGERARESFYSRGQCCVTSPASSLNFCCSNMQSTSNMALEWCSAKHATPFMSGCPRVFCMGKSGYLLLSNTGLLGIVCSCHCCHMSVLKFCEHSGLHGVNPGDAVRMESGETIAQWQKLYFLKFGIRSPGNESEWDWPEVLSAAGNLMKSNASASDMSKSDLSRILSSSAVTLRSEKYSDYVMFPKNADTDHNFFSGPLSRKQPITVQDGCNIPLKGLNAITQNNQYDRVKSQLMESNLAICSTASNFVGAQLDDGCQPKTPSLDSLKRNGNLSITHSTSQIPTSLLKDHECNKKKNAEVGLVGKDATSSNIELRLGQPPRARNPVPSFIEPPPFTFASPPKFQSLKQMTNNLSREEELQNNFSHAVGSFKMLEEQPQLKPRSYMSGVSNASGAATASSQIDNVVKSSSFLPFPQFNPQPKGKTKLCENLANDCIMPQKLHSEYSTMQFGPTNVPWNSNGHTGRQSNDSVPGFKLSNKYLGNDKGVSFAKDSCTKINSGFGVSQLMEFGSITRTAGGSGSCSPVVSGKIYESSFASDTSVGANVLHGSKNVSFAQNNHSTSWTAVPFEGFSKSLPYLVSSSTSNLNPTLLQQRGINMDTYMLDENMRLLALTQIQELSKQQHALYFHDMNQKQGRSNNITKAPKYIYEASIPEQGVSGASLKLPQNGGICGNPEITDDLNRYCHPSALTATPLHSKEKKSQCKRSYDLQNDGPSLSLGMNNTRTNEKCSEQPSDIHFVGKYTSAAWANGCRSNFCAGIEPPRDIAKEKFADASGVTSLKIASECSRDKNDENMYFELGGNLDGQGTVKSGSHIPQWRDVPSKVRTSVCDAMFLDQMATVLDWEGRDSVQMGIIPAKRLKKTIDREDLLKEQENFNVSSGCAAPVVSQASVMDVNKVDSCTVDATDTGYAENLVVDEGSGIDKGWSSDVVESESAEFPGSTSGSYLKKGYRRVLNDQSCRSLLDELKLLDSLIWKKGRDQNLVLAANCRGNQSQKVKKGFKGKKRKRNKVRILDASLLPGIPSSLDNQNGESTGAFDPPSSLSEEMQLYFSSSQQISSNKASIVQPSTAFSSKFLSCENHLSKHHSDEDSYESESNSDAEFHTLPGISGLKKLRKDFTSDCYGHFQMQEPSNEEPKNATQGSSSSRKASPHRITRPVVCGKYGEISSEPSSREVPKPAKIVSLSKVLKTSERCMVPTIGKPRLTTKMKWRRLSFGTSSGHCFVKPGLKAKEDNNESQDTIICDETKSDVSMEDFQRGSKRNVIYKGKSDTKIRQGDNVNRADAPLKVKGKEIRKQRSINEITAKETKVQDILKYAEDMEHGLCNTKSKSSVQDHTNISIINADAFCCVCRSSSNDKINSLLECCRCLTKVHQACYGISTLPKRGRWCCRPCRTNSNDIACVLCGYGGGAMTRALSSHSIVKSLLKVWNSEKDGMPKHATSREIFGKEVEAFHSSETGWEVDQECVLRPENVSTSTNLYRVEMSTNHVQHTPCSVTNFKVHNSITAGALDSTVKQWVHMVCGLWTPGTRCPNVDTMSAFDVSGVSRPKADVVCSICNRWGGSCIECRIVDCSVKFHPWCAHQKNLLQGETEGVNDENIGFYGRCALHAIGPKCQSTDPIDEMGSREEKEFTCARTEGYKGRRWDGFQNNHYSALKPRAGCLVPEEQLNAWIHINGQKLCSQGIPKFSDSDIEHDCRKEYARYKQVKGWKHLVVYKSGIHALGLYTSQFISRGRMVVEYIGEIVGLRVADKREIEYQSGRKLQYKSACYFFRIDKEHIIDATRKGGIARFVNHSCLPNCVAKVIAVRHEKKVVFFAERDIFPGEEITYDYHFNHEDEGKKIPCYCNSKNCRRYLN